MSTPLSFGEGDQEALDNMCMDARLTAQAAPCRVKEDATDPKYSFKFGPWHLSLTKDEFAKPRSWHASAALLKEIGTQPTTLDSGLIVEAPQDALVVVESWDQEERDQAEYLLGKLLAPMITDQQQRVNVFDGLFALHYVTEIK